MKSSNLITFLRKIIWASSKKIQILNIWNWIRIVNHFKKYEIISETDHIQKVQILTCHVNQNIWSRIGQESFCFWRIFRKSASEQSYKIFHCHFVSTIINFDVVTVHINIFILKLNNEVIRKLFEVKEVNQHCLQCSS